MGEGGRNNWSARQWQEYHERVVDKLRHDQAIQERVQDGGRALLKRVSQELELSLEKIRAQNRELDQARRSAEDADRAKSEFLALITHEIRTPLSSILGMLELFQETTLDRKQLEYLKICKHNSEILLGLINNVLDCSRIEAGAETVSLDPTDVVLTVENTVAAFERQAALKGLDLRLEVEERPPGRIFTDHGKLKQILVNLVGNAVKYTEAGEVCVALRRSGAGELGILVRDTGIGIPEDEVETIFEAYGRSSASCPGRAASTGLGLYISKRLARLLGGELTAESTLGRGSRFTLLLPAIPAPAAQPDQAAKPQDTTDHLCGQRVLAVEDDQSMRDLVRLFLEGQHVDLRFAPDGYSACEMVRLHRYDLILMDMHLPGMDGIEATRKILSMNHGSAPPIIAVTAEHTPETGQRFLEAGCCAVLAKPISRFALVEAIAHWTGRDS